MTAYYNEIDRTSMIAYRITNAATGRCYIGVTVRGLRRRWTDHLRAARNGVKTALYAAIRKHGEQAFSIEHIASATSRELLKALERAIIDQDCTLAPGGYNLTRGGDGVDGLPDNIRARIAESNRGRTHTPEARALIGAASRGHAVPPDVRERISQKHLGKKLSLEHRAKLSAAKIGKKLPPRSAEHAARISAGLVRAHAKRRDP